jgi:hypothetical protein
MVVYIKDAVVACSADVSNMNIMSTRLVFQVIKVGGRNRFIVIRWQEEFGGREDGIGPEGFRLRSVLRYHKLVVLLRPR